MGLPPGGPKALAISRNEDVAGGIYMSNDQRPRGGNDQGSSDLFTRTGRATQKVRADSEGLLEVEHIDPDGVLLAADLTIEYDLFPIRRDVRASIECR